MPEDNGATMTEQPAGDPQWVRSVVERYEQPLLLYALRLTGDVDRARDVVQETFLRLCPQPRHVVEDHLAEWLYSVCRNFAIDIRRKERRMVQFAEDGSDIPVAEAPPPERKFEENEQAARLVKMMDRLPANQQEVLRLKFQHGLSYKQISEVTQLTIGNVGFLIHTGLKALRARVTEDARVTS